MAGYRTGLLTAFLVVMTVAAAPASGAGPDGVKQAGPAPHAFTLVQERQGPGFIRENTGGQREKKWDRRKSFRGESLMDPQKREALRQELMNLPPEERKARMEQLRREFQQKREQTVEERRAQFQERWDSASPEDKAKFCGRARERCAAGGGEGQACAWAENSCSGM